MCIQLTELGRCVNVAVQKPFPWRIWKEIFPAICRLLKISCKIVSKPQENRLFQTALLCVPSPSEVASIFRFSELETGVMRNIWLKTKAELYSRMIVKVYIKLTEVNNCVNVAFH